MATLPAGRHERLEAWQACFRLAVAVYDATTRFPREERYGLAAQARSAAYSAGANIVEGLARKGSREFARFLNYSVGSLAELGFALLLAREAGILRAPDWNQLETLRTRAAQLTAGLLRAVQRRRSVDT
jgi:four helix bundle protein